MRFRPNFFLNPVLSDVLKDDPDSVATLMQPQNEEDQSNSVTRGLKSGSFPDSTNKTGPQKSQIFTMEDLCTRSLLLLLVATHLGLCADANLHEKITNLAEKNQQNEVESCNTEADEDTTPNPDIFKDPPHIRQQLEQCRRELDEIDRKYTTPKYPQPEYLDGDSCLHSNRAESITMIRRFNIKIFADSIIFGISILAIISASSVYAVVFVYVGKPFHDPPWRIDELKYLHCHIDDCKAWFNKSDYKSYVLHMYDHFFNQQNFYVTWPPYIDKQNFTCYKEGCHQMFEEPGDFFAHVHEHLIEENVTDRTLFTTERTVAMADFFSVPKTSTVPDRSPRKCYMCNATLYSRDSLDKHIIKHAFNVTNDTQVFNKHYNEHVWDVARTKMKLRSEIYDRMDKLYEEAEQLKRLERTKQADAASSVKDDHDRRKRSVDTPSNLDPESERQLKLFLQTRRDIETRPKRDLREADALETDLRETDALRLERTKQADAASSIKDDHDRRKRSVDTPSNLDPESERQLKLFLQTRRDIETRQKRDLREADALETDLRETDAHDLNEIDAREISASDELAELTQRRKRALRTKREMDFEKIKNELRYEMLSTVGWEPQQVCECCNDTGFKNRDEYIIHLKEHIGNQSFFDQIAELPKTTYKSIEFTGFTTKWRNGSEEKRYRQAGRDVISDWQDWLIAKRRGTDNRTIEEYRRDRAIDLGLRYGLLRTRKTTLPPPPPPPSSKEVNAALNKKLNDVKEKLRQYQERKSKGNKENQTDVSKEIDHKIADLKRKMDDIKAKYNSTKRRARRSPKECPNIFNRP
ncbi:uncharacterized protein LOC103512765 [Diaphorina citri]|uniref:Uncharacterized protein LOC103512765 n=1 Tax=Diaphorina citri TaxID=121845 RepID=A0A3Q0J5H1_DIACI|nr:uncharacterized protein LOC103512765 [Diaphorina citri]